MFYLPVDSMGLGLELNSFVVGHLHVVADIVAAQHAVVDFGMLCTNYSVRLDDVAVAAIAVAIVVAIPIADDNNHLHCPVDLYFGLRQIDGDPSKVVATIYRFSRLDFIFELCMVGL